MALLIIAAATLWGATRPPVGHKQIPFTETMPDLEIV